MLNKEKKVQPTSESGNAAKPIVTCRCKRVIVEYFVAVTSNGDEVEIRGIDKEELKHDMELTGELNEDYKQQQYENGEWSRSYKIDKWLQVSNGR